jgi:hypothetical protein
MPDILSITIIFLLIIIGSSLLFFTIFGLEIISSRGNDKMEKIRKKYSTLLLTIGVILIIGAFSVIISPANHPDNKWTNEQKEEMIKKIMESSIFIHGIGTDTARLVSECFIGNYTRTYSPLEMREQNKMSNKDISRLTSVIMIECLKKYGLPMIDTLY